MKNKKMKKFLIFSVILLTFFATNGNKVSNKKLKEKHNYN